LFILFLFISFFGDFVIVIFLISIFVFFIIIIFFVGLSFCFIAGRAFLIIISFCGLFITQVVTFSFIVAAVHAIISFWLVAT
jgi:hypothetical protein